MNRPAKSLAKPYFALLVGILSLGSSALFVQWANAPGIISSFYRMGIGAVVFAIPFMFRARSHGPVNRKGVALALLAGVFFGADMAFWSEGILLSGATNPTLMANTAPAWVGLGAMIFFRERLPRRFWGGLVLALAGAAIILGVASSQGFKLGIGSLFGLVAGMFYGGFFLIAQKGRVLMDSVQFFWFSVLASTVVLGVLGMVRGLSFMNYPAQSFWIFLASGLIVQVAGWFGINYAQGFLPATVISPTMLGQPVITTILAVLLLGEAVSLTQLVGGAAIIAGIYLVHLSRGKADVPEAAPGPT